MISKAGRRWDRSPTKFYPVVTHAVLGAIDEGCAKSPSEKLLNTSPLKLDEFDQPAPHFHAKIGGF